MLGVGWHVGGVVGKLKEMIVSLYHSQQLAQAYLVGQWSQFVEDNLPRLQYLPP